MCWTVAGLKQMRGDRDTHKTQWSLYFIYEHSCGCGVGSPVHAKSTALASITHVKEAEKKSARVWWIQIDKFKFWFLLEPKNSQIGP